MSATKERAAATSRALEAARVLLASATPDPDRIGDLVWWQSSATWTADAPYVATILAAHGIEPDAVLPPAPDWSGAHARAILTTAAHARAQGYTLLDAANGDAGERRTAIVKIDRNGRVTTRDEGTIATARDGKSPPVIERFESDAASKIAEALLSAIHACHDTYRSDDMRIAVVAWLDLHAALLVRAGLYWIAPGAQPAIDAFDQAATALGWGTVEAYEGRKSQPRTLRAARSVVTQGIHARIRELSATVQATVDASGNVRPATLYARKEEIARIRQDVQLYSTVTGHEVSGVNGPLDSLDNAIALALARGQNARNDSDAG